MDADVLIEEIIQRQETVDRGDPLYTGAIGLMAAVDLSLTEDYAAPLKVLIKDFLYRWGRMGRVLGQKQYLDWQEKVVGIIRLDSGQLKQFQKRHIENEILEDHKDEIIRLYSSFNEVTGSIASAKILNLVCPDFFPLWDNDIGNAIRSELRHLPHGTFDKSIKAFSGEDYFRFMKEIQRFMSTHNRVISSLSSRYQRKKLRVIDQCFLWMVRRPLSPIF
ncbi:MAG: hypothetical protein HYX84_04505 [Chloroflexi bacterium]|nr:hypothetical protein [Chloroflexota bacterium]